MKLLLDTQLLLWAAVAPERLSARAKREINDPENQLLFSAASLWEIAIKSSLGRADFSIEPRVLRRAMLDKLAWCVRAPYGFSTTLPITLRPAMSFRALAAPVSG